MKPNLIPNICKVCGKKYYRQRSKKTNRLESLFNFQKRKFCSLKCYWEHLKEVQKGRNNPHWKNMIKKICPVCGKEFEVLPSRNKRIYCSHKCAGIFTRGKKRPNVGLKREKNPAWKGGVTKTGQLLRTQPEYLRWRMMILKRDNYTCQACGNRGCKLIAHHIENFSENKEKRMVMENGIILCKKCHIEFHNKYGRENNTKKQLEEFLSQTKPN